MKKIEAVIKPFKLEEVKEALAQFQTHGVRAVILDLRGNGGRFDLLRHLVLPVITLVAWLRFSPAATLSLRAPPWRGLLAAVLIGVTGWAAVGGLVMSAVAAVVLVWRYLRVKKILTCGITVKGVVEELEAVAFRTDSDSSTSKPSYRHVHFATLRYEVLGVEQQV